MTPHVALTIAGSDCCAGAGLQADLKTFHHFGIHGLTAVTCVVAETPREVRSIYPVTTPVLRDQLEILLETYPVAAIKTGMLYSADHILAVAEVLERFPQPRRVVDPVMIASTGDPLVEPAAMQAYIDRLLPLAHLITPNLDEAQALDGSTITRESQVEAAAARLASRFETAVLLKGGHLQGPDCGDYLFHQSGGRWFRSPRIKTRAGHGTGCTLSAAIAAGLANGHSLGKAVGQAKRFLDRSLSAALAWDDLQMLNQGLPDNPPVNPS